MIPYAYFKSTANFINTCDIIGLLYQFKFSDILSFHRLPHFRSHSMLSSQKYKLKYNSYQNMSKPHIYTVEQILGSYSKLDKAAFLLFWEQFFKWCYLQFQANRHISFGPSGDYGFKLQENTNHKIPFFFFNDQFLNKNHLSLKIKTFVLKPLVKLNSLAISKYLPKKIKEEDVQKILNHMIEFLQTKLKDKNEQFIVIDFDILGKIIRNNNEIWFEHSLPPKKDSLRNTSIRFQVNKEESKFSNVAPLSKLSLLSSQQGFLPKIQKRQLKSSQKQKQTPKKTDFILERIPRTSTPAKDQPFLAKRKLSLFKINSNENLQQNNQTNLAKRSVSLKDFSKTKLNAIYKPVDFGDKKNGTEGWEMMAAGPDPIKKAETFSKLATDLKGLMQAKFSFNQQQLQDNIPIIDTFSRTLACPIAAQRQNVLVAGRIGGNYCLNSQKIEVCEEGVRFVKIKNMILGSTDIQKANNLIGEIEEYVIITKERNNDDDQMVLDGLKKSFERYNKLFRMIPDEHLIKMQGDAVNNFLGKIKFNINKNPNLFDNVFQQIRHNYSNAIKKSIVDYILLDPVQRIRLFVNYKSRQVKMYGSTEKQQTVWKDFSFISVKYTVENKLMKNSRNVMRIIEEWKNKYLDLPVINIPSSFTQYFTIDDFCDKQKIQIKKFQQIILSQWIPNLSEIYQLQTIQLQKNMEKCQQFFESTNTLLYIQLRQKIISILAGYNQFFQFFNFEELNPPETVVHLQKSLGRYEKSFITVRVSHRRQQIYFMDNMDEIHTQLLQIVDLLRVVSVDVPRPQNLITKSKKHYLQRIQEDEVDFARLKKQISTIIKKNIENTKKSLQIFNKYQYLLTEMRQIEDWTENQMHDRREYSLIMTKYRKLYDEIMEQVPFFIRVNMIYVDSSELKRFFLSLVQQILVRIQQSVHSLVMRKNNEIQTSLQQMILVASSYATDCEKLVQIENQVEHFRRNDIKKLQNQKQDLVKWIAITLYNTYYPVNAEDLAKIYSTSQFLTNIYSLLNQENVHIEDQRLRLQTEVRRQSSSLNLKTHTLVKQCQKLRQFSGTIVKDSALSLIRQCRHKITQYKEQKKTVDKKEELLGIQQTELAKLLEWDKNLVPFEDLWNLVDNYSSYYQSWSKQNIFKQNSQLIGSECKAMLRTLILLMNHQMLKNFAPLSLKMAENMSEEIKKFQASIPLIAVFSNPGLKDRHLKKIADTIQFKGDITSLNGLNLQKLVLMNGHQYIKELEVISYEATREYTVELVIKKVKQQWKNIAFEIVKYKDNETSIITGSCLQMVEGLLEVHLLEVLSVKGSIYAKIFEQELQELQNWLSSTLELVQYSAKVQNYWTYLEPVMNSHDILKHLSVEGSKFLLVDDQFKKISVFYNQTRNVVEITKNKEVVKNLKNCLKNIQIVQKGLSSYLDSKRMNFPRFFSLSDGQLLEILSQKKDPLGLQKHVRKCFEGIEKLKFEQNQYIVGMVSRQGEQVPFSSKINTLMARGNVDQIMKEIEQKMFNNVKRQIDETLADYSILQRNQIINKRFQMAVLTAQQIRWTAAVQESIVGHKLKQLTEKIGNDLKGLMQLVKQQNLDQALTLKLESLLILAVKNRQIGESLEKKSISNIRDFEWQAQIKFYQFLIEQTKEIRCSAKIFGTSIPFNYEYLGNYSRLVITPLTDRCHRTIFLAMNHNLGGALQGPSGTGKTQTVKDLAKALAYRCIMFNCSELLDFKTVARLLKGLASTGSWGNLDGLNKTSIDVLSVVGQQIYVIQKAKKQKKNMFFFEDIELKLKSGTQIFVTLNPLSAGKISLPENLKSQFRPISMVTMETQKVCEVLLLIGGFSQSEVLATKLINFFKLAQNYLSEASWQGGMKTIKCLVNKAIELEKNDSKASEEKIVVKSISATIFPRLIKQDLILCKGILKDSFGENSEPEMSNDVLIQKIRAQMNEEKLTLTQYGTQKMLQLHEMLAVRRQIVLTGQPYSGKSTAIQILRSSINKLEGQANVQMAKINPKSIDLKQLVGAYDSSNDWFDGILGVKLRLLAEQGSGDMKWLILDGPLDPSWTESINSVLDENKKLCLSNGEIIPVSENVTIILESTDLLNSSPAIVARCGIIHFEVESQGYEVLVTSWKKKNYSLGKYAMKTIDSFLQKLPKLYAQVLELKPAYVPSIMNLTFQFLELFDSFVQVIKANLTESIKAKLASGEYKEESPVQIEIEISLNQKQFYSASGSSFIFAILWSFGACIDSGSRKAIELCLKRLIISDFSKTKNEKIYLPDKGTLFQFFLEVNQQPVMNVQWKKWSDKLRLEQPQTSNYPHSIIVKTPLFEANNFIIQLTLSRNIPILLYGSNGTGKSTLFKNYFAKHFDGKFKGYTQFALSSSSKSQYLRNFIESNLEKKGSKLIIGPKNASQMIVAVDDVNMPENQLFGAQPSIELLRQIIDSKGLYDLDSRQKSFRKIMNLNFAFSISSSRINISPRFMRHTFMLLTSPYDQDTAIQILTSIFTYHFTGHPELRNIKTLIKYCMEMYDFCTQSFPCVPSKLHYNFNFKDIHSLALSICRADKDKVHSENIGRLWAHEAKRIFQDRLTPCERHLVSQTVQKITKKWGKNFTQTYFTDMLSIQGDKSYQEVNDIEKINLSLTTSLNNYNMNTQKPMDIVLFKYILEHILKINRIIMQPKSYHCLLIGTSGTGRKSCAAIASYASGFQQFSLNRNKTLSERQLLKSIKVLFDEVGVSGKKTTWIINESQLNNDKFCDWINSIIKLGIVPYLFDNEQKILICEKLRSQANQKLPEDISLQRIFSYFEEKVKQNLKVILCLNPGSQQFYKKLRRFPSFYNSTSINWLEQWPEQSLISVARNSLTNIQIKHKDRFLKGIQYLLTSSKQQSLLYYQETKRLACITPSSYLQFINILKTLLVKKRRQIKELIFKYSKGYDKIIEAEEKIQQMKLNLQEMKPKLKNSAEQTSNKLIQVELQKSELDMLVQNLTLQEKNAFQAISEADSIKKQCEQALEAALPQLKDAQSSLMVLDKNSLIELKTMANPPLAVKLVFQGLCYLIDPNPKQKIKNQKTFKMETDWWAASQRNLTNSKLLESLIGFNKQSIPEKSITNLATFLQDPANKQILSVENVAKSSSACQCIIRWIQGIYNFYFVNKSIEPKKQMLAEAETRVKQLNQKLALKRQQIQVFNGKLSQLSYELQWAQKIKLKLQNEYQQCETFLERANIISTNLKAQKTKWHEMSEFYKKKQNRIDANVLFSSAQVCYFGPYNQDYRKKITGQCKDSLKKAQLQIEQDFNLINFLSSPTQVRDWNINGLPTDSFSTENAIIITNSKRWPLMIDPQEQAIKWIKAQQRSKKIKSLKPSQDNFLRNLENCIQFGTPVLIQNLGDEINRELNPILLKQMYKKGPTTYLKIGQNPLIYSTDFMLYLSTKIRNPQYPAELFPQISLINFTLPEQGLRNHMLTLIVSKQRPEIEQERLGLMQESSNNSKFMKDLESRILQTLNNTQNILLNQNAINVLTESKSKTLQIEENDEIIKNTEATIEQNRMAYDSLADEAASLYQCISSLVNLNRMYQFSLNNFIDLFATLLNKNDKSEDLAVRIEKVKKNLKLIVFNNISRSLFQKDRLAFALMLTFRLAKFPTYIPNFLFAPHKVPVQPAKNKPELSWLSDKVWMQICRLQKLQKFESLSDLFYDPEQAKYFKAFIESPQPFAKQLPFKCQSLPLKDKLLIYKCLRPQKMQQAFKITVSKMLGQHFVSNANSTIEDIYKDSSFKSPIMILLAQASDPLQQIYHLSRKHKASLEVLSLGQGQGQVADRLIRQNLIKGGWVLLQNGHLALNWMDNLVKLLEWLEQEGKQINTNFRLWLTCSPVFDFPSQVIQKSTKIAHEGSKEINFVSLLKKKADKLQKTVENKTVKKYCENLMGSLCLMHFMLLQRKNYGELGWKTLYNFSQNDLKLGLSEIESYFSAKQSESEICLDAIESMIGVSLYGERITINNDKKILTEMIKTHLNPECMQDPFHSIRGLVQVQKQSNFENVFSELSNIKIFNLIGMNSNAYIAKEDIQSNQIIVSLRNCFFIPNQLQIHSQEIEEKICLQAEQILKLPIFYKEIDQQTAKRKYPISYEEPLHAVLHRQISKYKLLLQNMKLSLEELIKTLKGQIPMSPDTENAFVCLIQDKIPFIWIKLSYPSDYRLAHFLTELAKRIDFFKSWIQKGRPDQFNIGYFFSPNSFITAIQLNYSRLSQTPIAQVNLEFVFDKRQFSDNPKKGAIIKGLYIGGAKWSQSSQILQELQYGQLLSESPSIFIKPIKSAETLQQKLIEVPVYRIFTHKKIYNDTNHNVLFEIKVPTDKDPIHLIQKGVCFFTQNIY